MSIGKIILQKGFLLSLSRGFTLIELLIVMAIIGVLAAGVLIAVNPQDKVRQANDAKVVSDVTQVGRAADRYAIGHNGAYPGGTYAGATADLVTSGDLRAAPSNPTAAGYNAYVYSPLPAGCTTAAGSCTSFTLSGNLLSNSNTATPVAKYESTTGRSCRVATVATACP